MIRKPFMHLLFGLLCLSLAACGTLDVGLDGGLQQEPAVGQVEAAEPVVALSKETHTPATPGTTEPALLETQTATSTGGTETELVTGAVVASDTTPEDPVYAQKAGETVTLPACYDFDEGASVVPPDPACDFSMLPGPDSGTIEIYPQAGAQLAYGGVFPAAPTPAQCAADDAFSGERETVAPMAAMYVCYRTGAGRTGYLHFTAADLEQAGTLTLDWVTYAGDIGAGRNGDGEKLTYRDDTFGFELALPTTWTGFDTTQHDHEDGSNICFTFTGSAPFCVLQIDVWRKAAWNELERVPEGYYLGENENFVFATGPYQTDCVQLDDFQCARHQELPAILAGFRVE